MTQQMLRVACTARRKSIWLSICQQTSKLPFCIVAALLLPCWRDGSIINIGAHLSQQTALLQLYLSAQAALDAREAEAAQAAWLQERIAAHFTPKLLQMTRDIARLVNPGDGDPSHAFPQLAGSHLSEACADLICVAIPALLIVSCRKVFCRWSYRVIKPMRAQLSCT